MKNNQQQTQGKCQLSTRYYKMNISSTNDWEYDSRMAGHAYLSRKCLNGSQL